MHENILIYALICVLFIIEFYNYIKSKFNTNSLTFSDFSTMIVQMSGSLYNHYRVNKNMSEKEIKKRIFEDIYQSIDIEKYKTIFGLTQTGIELLIAFYIKTIVDHINYENIHTKI